MHHGTWTARAALAAVGLLVGAGLAYADGPPTRLRGTLAGVSGGDLTITTNDGATVHATLADTTRFASVTHADIGAIAADSYVGVAALPGADGKLQALEVTVFAQSMRGMGDGHYPWDRGPDSTMTNGAVGSVSGTAGRTMTVRYKGGEKDIMVPPDVPIVNIKPADRAVLVAGAHVVVFAPPVASGPYAAAVVIAGENGVVPPM